jgi:hypothetical protein
MMEDQFAAQTSSELIIIRDSFIHFNQDIIVSMISTDFSTTGVIQWKDLHFVRER